MRSVVSRLARLERLNRLSTAPQRIRIQYGYLTTLPDDYIGPRHVVTVKQIPPEELPPTERANPWLEWEARRGPGPAEDADRLRDEQIIRVSYWKGRGRLAANGNRGPHPRMERATVRYRYVSLSSQPLLRLCSIMRYYEIGESTTDSLVIGVAAVQRRIHSSCCARRHQSSFLLRRLQRAEKASRRATL